MADCEVLGEKFLQCRVQDSDGTCTSSSCPLIGPEFLTVFPGKVYERFIMTMSTTSMDKVDFFCETALKDTCAEYEDNACCCEPEFTEWQECLVVKEASPMVGLASDCKTCEPLTPPPPVSQCTAEGMSFVQCKSMDTTGTCAASCPPANMATITTDFPAALDSQFMMTQGSVPSTDPGFCGAAQTGICQGYAANACCCEPEFAVWQNCLVEKDFSPQMGLAVPCTVSCQNSGGGGGGGSLVIIVVVVVLLLLAISGVAGAFFFLRRRRVNNNANDMCGDGDDDDWNGGKNSKKPNSQTAGKKPSFFSIGDRKRSGRNNKNNAQQDGMHMDDYDCEDNENGNYQDNNKKTKNGKKNPRTPNSNGKNKRNKKRGGSYDESDAENGGLQPTDLSLSQDDDSIDNDYGDESTNYGRQRQQERDAPIVSPRESRARDARNKKRSIESSRMNSSYRSSRYDDDDDDVSEMDAHEVEQSRSSSRRDTMELPSKIKSSRKISSRELKELMREKQESSRRLNDMEDEVAEVENLLAKRDKEAEKLRREREDQALRIEELEAKNEKLKKKVVRSNSRRNLERQSSDRSSVKMSIDSSGKISRDSSYTDDYSNGKKGKARSSRSKASMREDPEPSRDRKRSKSKSRGGLERQGSSRRPQSRSPSSTRSLGKQASSLRRQSSSGRLDRGDSRRSNNEKSDLRKARSRSPRSYLRDEDF